MQESEFGRFFNTNASSEQGFCFFFAENVLAWCLLKSYVSCLSSSSLQPGLFVCLKICMSVFSVEAEAEEPAAEADHGPASQPHLGDQLHAGCQELSHTDTHAFI